MKSISNVRARQRGTQILEFALVLPLLAFLAMMIVEAALFIRAHEIINNAAREGARVAAQMEGQDFIDVSGRNVVGEMTACRYVNQYKNAFPDWNGDTNCSAPFEIIVEPVPPGDPEEVTVDGVNMPTTRGIVRYDYRLKWVPFASFFGGPNATVLHLEARAQFRNFY
jgi:hypothetical protein